MKKIIVTLLAMMMVASLFAEIAPVTTSVNLKLELEPEYLFGVTTTVPVEADTELQGKQTEITMTYDKDTFKLNDKGSLYVSYIFKEYKACTLSAKLDGNLILLEGESPVLSPTDEQQIKFEADITVYGSTKNLKSSTKNSETLVTVTPDATKKGETVRNGFALVLKGSTEADDPGVKGKKVGSYKANLVLTVTETA